MSAFTVQKQSLSLEEAALTISRWFSFQRGKKSPEQSCRDKRLRNLENDPTKRGIQECFEDLVELGQEFLPAQFLEENVRKELIEELQLFLPKLELLLKHCFGAGCPSKVVRWCIATRFFVPWLALRVAILRRRNGRSSIHSVLSTLDTWIDGTEPLFLRVVNERIRKAGEGDNALVARLAVPTQPDRTALKIGLRRLENNRKPLSDHAFRLLEAGAHSDRRLWSELYFARAIDRSLADAEAKFGRAAAKELVCFFRLCLRQFTAILNQKDISENEARLLPYLSSQTISGNTPFNSEWLFPLVQDPFANALVY